MAGIHDGKIGERADVYRILSRAFYEPEKDLAEDFTGLAPVIEDLCPELGEWFAKTRESLLAGIGDLRALTDGYHELFAGPFQVQAPPYASAYLEGGIIVEETTMSVAECYTSAGVELDGDPELVSDHVAVECEFVSYCLESYIDIGDESFYDLHAAFIQGHLAKWFPSFTDRVLAQEKAPAFYLDLAHLARRFIECDLAFLRGNKNSLQ